MKDKHITGILDNTPTASLSEADRQAINAHIKTCATCREAYEAAQLSELLIKDRASETIEPSPFFQTRVMAALERTAGEWLFSFWQALEVRRRVGFFPRVDNGGARGVEFYHSRIDDPGAGGHDCRG